MNCSDKSTQELQTELERLEHELDYQVHHKRIAELQERIEAIENEIQRRNENGYDE